MKKLLGITALILAVSALVFAFAACGSKPAAKDIHLDLNAVMNGISTSIKMPEETTEIASAEDLMDYYGIDAALTNEYKIIMNASGFQDEFIMIEAVDAAAAEQIAGILEEYRQGRMDEMKNYSPDMYKILENSVVNTTGRYVSLFVSEENEKIVSVYNSFFA